MARVAPHADTEAFLRLMYRPGDVFEVRAPKCAPNLRTIGGYFRYESANKATEAIATIDASGRAPAIYVSLNPVTPDLLARSAERLKEQTTTTADTQIVERRWVLIDCDPRRPSGTSSTDGELAAAGAKATEISEYLRARGWPDPVRSMSGNGHHLLYPVELPANDSGLVERVLKSLAGRFDDALVAIDTSVANPSRITKVPGTLARKGDDFQGFDGIAARPHRRAVLLTREAPNRAVTREQLEALAPASPCTARAQSTPPSCSRSLDRFSRDAAGVREYLTSHGVNVTGENRKDDATFLYLDRCPVIPDCVSESGSDIAVIVGDSGKTSYKNMHNRGADLKWADLRRAIEPGYHPARDRGTHSSTVETNAPVIETISGLIRAFPKLREPVVDGLLRRGEVFNVVAPPKIGKSWAAQSLALSVATGGDWFGFRARKGRALLVDVELHAETLAFRLKTVCQQNNVDPEKVAADFEVMRLRGKLLNIHQVMEFLLRLPPGTFDLVVLDPLYRLLPRDGDENSNATVSEMYNCLDAIAAHLDAAVVVVHHTSKGTQLRKSVTDIGAGGGAQTRAADSHLVFREIEEGLVVAQAVLRSYPPMAAFVARFEGGRWCRDTTLDPESLLKGKRTREKAPPSKASQALTAETFASRYVGPEPVIREEVFSRAYKDRVSKTDATALLKLAEEQGYITRHQHQNQPHRFSTGGGGCPSTPHPQSLQPLGGCGGDTQPPLPPSPSTPKKKKKAA
ncbi:MAG TPA: AAA family ATPase [Phycisphaerales bacterium]|nr:AAA family ATPase [Phycisphaerales bacterium]